MNTYLFTSESVTKGHPDKICDQISDAILDAYLSIDPNSKVACECCIAKNIIFVAGEISSQAEVDIEKIVRDTVCNIGYNSPEKLFDGHTCEIFFSLSNQSEDIALGLNHSLESKEGSAEIVDKLGAGDQGIMFGYACDETDALMPMPIYYAHQLAQALDFARENNIIEGILPDGKTQVTVEYKDDIPLRIDTIVISTQHRPNKNLELLRKEILKEVIFKICPKTLIDNKTKVYINPTGRFVVGGPNADTGLTGRKIIVDTYGGICAHGGGAFSGKDPTKVDRSAAYYLRYIAKSLVSANLVKRIEIQSGYAIGKAQPISLRINTFGTAKVTDNEMHAIIKDNFDLRPANMIEELNLKGTKYLPLACYGHFGRMDQNVRWEFIKRLKFQMYSNNSQM